MDYSFLSSVVAGFHTDKLELSKRKQYSEAERGAFFEKLKCLKADKLISDADYDHIIKPILYGDLEKIALIASLHTECSALEEDDERIIVETRIVGTKPVKLALDWTLIHIDNLGLKGLDVDAAIGQEIRRPHRQCLYCGNIRNEYGQRFPGRAIKANYCHRIDCPKGVSVSPSDHVGCCYGDWLLLYRRFRSRLNEIAKKGLSPSKAKKEIAAKFEIMLEELYQGNLKISWDIEAEPDPEKLEEAKRLYELDKLDNGEKDRLFFKRSSSPPGVSVSEYQQHRHDSYLIHWYKEKYSPR